MAAGIEGGSWDAVCERWDLFQYRAMRKHWREHGPPVYIAVAAYLGLNEKPKTPSQDDGGVPLS